MKAIGYVLLRCVVIVTAVVLLATAAAVIGARLPSPPARSFDQSFDRLGTHLWIGGGVGLLLGVALAFGLGQGAFSRLDRAMQTLAALGVPALLLLGEAMER